MFIYVSTITRRTHSLLGALLLINPFAFALAFQAFIIILFHYVPGAEKIRIVNAPGTFFMKSIFSIMIY